MKVQAWTVALLLGTGILSLPSAVRDGLHQLAASGKIGKVESLTKERPPSVARARALCPSRSRAACGRWISWPA